MINNKQEKHLKYTGEYLKKTSYHGVFYFNLNLETKKCIGFQTEIGDQGDRGHTHKVRVLTTTLPTPSPKNLLHFYEKSGY